MASLTGDQFKYEMMQLIRNSFLNQNYHFSNYWDVTELETVRNLELETQYKVKRDLMLDFGRSNEETAEVLLVDCYKNVDDVKFISLNGLQCGRHANSFLGNGGKGVTIGKHADILLRSFYNDGHDQCWIVVFKAILGRQKEVLPIQTPPFREPAQDADCHVSLLAPAPNEDALHVQEIKSQVFMYDKDEDGEFLRRPRQCLPIAYVMLRRAPPLQPLQPIAIRDKAPNAAADDACNNRATTKANSAAQVDGIVRNRRGIKTKGKRRERMAWQLIPVDAKNTSQQKLLKSSNRQKIPKPCQKRTIRKLKEGKDPAATVAAAAAAAAAAQNKRVAISSLRKQANSKCTTTEFKSSSSRQENRISFENMADKSRLSKIPSNKCSQEQFSQHLSADTSNNDQSPLVAAKTVPWSTAYKPDHIPATALDPRRRQQTAAAKDSTAAVMSSNPNADDFSLRSPSIDSASAALRPTSDDHHHHRTDAAASKTPASGSRRTCLIDALPLSPSLAPSASAAAAVVRSKTAVAGGRDAASKTRKSSSGSTTQSTFVSRTVTGIDPRTAHKPSQSSSSSFSYGSSPSSNATARQRTALRGTATPSASSASSSAASSHFQTDSSTDVSSKTRDIPNAQRATGKKTSSDGETHSDAIRSNANNGQRTEAAVCSDKRRASFPAPPLPPPLLPPPLLLPPPSKSGPLSGVSESQSTVALQFSSRTTALRFPAENEAQVVDIRNFSFDGSCGASKALIRSTISMRTEFRHDQSEVSSRPLNGQLNMHASPHHSAGQSNRLQGLGPMTLHQPIASVANESQHQQQQHQQQQLLMLQRGFISSITKQLASDLNDVANVLRNSKQQRTTTEAERQASGYLREINCRFMELGPVCTQYKQLFRCLPSDAAPIVSLPGCQRLYEHEQILKNCCDVLGRVFGELKSLHLHQNQAEQKSRTHAWLVNRKTVLCNCIDALKKVLENVVLECAPYQRDAQKPSPNVAFDKAVTPNTLSCNSLKLLCSNDLPVTSSSDSCLTIGRDPKAISEHSTANIEKASFDCSSEQTLVSAVKTIGSKDSNRAFDCVEINGSQQKSLLENGIEPEEKEQRKEQERRLEISSAKEKTLRKCDNFIGDQTESTSEGEEGSRHQLMGSKSCNGNAADSAAELKQTSLDFNANEDLRSGANQEQGKGENSEAAEDPIKTNGSNEANEDPATKCPNRNDDITAETEEAFLNTNAATTDRCASVEPNPAPIPLEHGSSALISLVQSSSKSVSRSSDLPIVKIERDDDQDGGGVCHVPQPLHTIIFDADDFIPPSSNDTTDADAWLHAHLAWEKKPIPVNANPRNDEDNGGSGVAVRGTMESGDIPPPLLTPSCAFDPKALLYAVKFDEDEPPVLEANEISSNAIPADDRTAADDRRQMKIRNEIECNSSSGSSSGPTEDAVVVCKQSSSNASCTSASVAGPVTVAVRSEFQGSGSSEDFAGKFCFGRIVGEMILPKDDAAATNESEDKSVFRGKMEERCFGDDVTPFDADADDRNPPRPADSLQKSASDDVKGQVPFLAPEIPSGVGQFDCGYDLRFKDDDFETLNNNNSSSEAQFVLTIEPDDDFDPDSVCFLESQTTNGAATADDNDDDRSSAPGGRRVDGKNEFEPTESFQRGENSISGSNVNISSDENSRVSVAEDSLSRTESSQVDPSSSAEPVPEIDRVTSANSASEGSSDRPEAATGQDAALPPSSASPRGTDGGPPAPLSVTISPPMTVFSESPESPSPESNAVCPTFHGLISAAAVAAAAAARSEVQSKQQAAASLKRKRRHRDVDQKPVVVKAKEEKCSAAEEEDKDRSRDASLPPPPPAKRSYVPTWSLKPSHCSAAGQELRHSFARFLAFHPSLLSERTQFKAKSESKRTGKSFMNDEDEDSERRFERDEKQRFNHDPERKIDESGEESRRWSRSRRMRRDSGAGMQDSSWHRRSSKTSSRGTEDSEYDIRHSEFLRNERKPNRWSSDRSSNPRRDCSSKDRSSPDRTRFPETRQQRPDPVRLRSPLGRTDRHLSRGDDYARRRTTNYRHFGGGSEETRWQRSEGRGQDHRRIGSSSGRRCDDDRSLRRVSDPSKLKRQFWSRGHPRFRCHDGCERCPAAAEAAPDDAATPSPSSGPFLPHPRNRNDIVEETLLVNLRATRTDVNLLLVRDDDDEEEEGERTTTRRRTAKREQTEEQRKENGGRRSKASSSNHDSEQDAKKKNKDTTSGRRSKKEEEEEDRRAKSSSVSDSTPKKKKEKSRTPSSSTTEQPMTPASSSNCGSDYAHLLPRRTVVDYRDLEERTPPPPGPQRTQTSFDQVTTMRSPLRDAAGGTGVRPGVVTPSRVAAPTYVTEVLTTKNFSTEVSFERFKS